MSIFKQIANCRFVTCVFFSVFLMVAASAVSAATIYRCSGENGSVAFQDHACAPGQRQTVVPVRAAVAYAPSPHYAVDKLPRKHQRASSRQRKSNSPMSYQCRASDGEVFYRHQGCPHSIVGRDNPRRRASVSATRVPRAFACRQLRRAGAIGRSGHGYDEDVSTYERNLGNDPCD